MTNAVLTRLGEERAAQEAFIEGLLEQAAERDLVDAELANVRAAKERIEQIDAQMGPLAAFEEQRRSGIQLDAILGGEGRAPIVTMPREQQFRTIGEAFVESDQFVNYRGRGASDPFAVPALPWELRASADPLLTTSTGSGSPKVVDMLPAPEKQVKDGPLRQHPLLALVGREETSATSGTIVVTGDATGHAVVAEGAKKPAINWTDTVQSWTLSNVAGWKKFSRQTLEDIPGFQSFINGKLQRSLLNALEDLAQTCLTGMFTAGNSTTGASKVPLENLIREAIGTLQARGVQPTAVALNPADHAAIDIAVMKSTLLGPTIRPEYFGLQIVSLPYLTAGTAIVGDINQAVTWKSKGGVNLYITDSDVSEGASTVTSDFQRNILTALLETRAAFIATDASVVQKVTLTP